MITQIKDLGCKYNTDLIVKSILKYLTRIILSPKKKTTDAYGTAAHRITQLIDMNWDPTNVINTGILLPALDSEEAMEVEMASASPK